MGDNEGLCAMEPCLDFERAQPQIRLEPRTTRSVGQLNLLGYVQSFVNDT